MKTQEDFWKNVQRGSGCWLFKPKKISYYGIFRGQAAHRYSWQMHNGPIPVGMFVLHKCDVPHCVRPEHLFLGNQADNMRDMHRKKRRSGTWPKGFRTEDIKDYFTVKEALDFLAKNGIARTAQWLYTMIVTGNIQSLKVVNSRAILKESVFNFIKQRRGETHGAKDH